MITGMIQNRAGYQGGARRRGGFTIIEVLIVLAIIVALTGLIGVAVFSRRDDAKKDTAKIELNTIKNALKLFQMDFDRWPTDQEGIKVLWDKTALDSEADATRWKKYLTEPLPKDKWGNEWGYRQKSERGDESMFDLWSFGPDKQDGTEDDITSWGAASGGEGPMEEVPSGSRSAPN